MKSIQNDHVGAGIKRNQEKLFSGRGKFFRKNESQILKTSISTIFLFSNPPSFEYSMKIELSRSVPFFSTHDIGLGRDSYMEEVELVGRLRSSFDSGDKDDSRDFNRTDTCIVASYIPLHIISLLKILVESKYQTLYSSIR